MWSACAPDFGTRAVLDRFAQIEPTVLVAVDGYRFNGREFDRRDVVAQCRELDAQALARAGEGLGGALVGLLQAAVVVEEALEQRGLDASVEIQLLLARMKQISRAKPGARKAQASEAQTTISSSARMPANATRSRASSSVAWRSTCPRRRP